MRTNTFTRARAAAEYAETLAAVHDPRCDGSGRRWSSGTVPDNAICPVCHAGPRAIGGPDAKHPRRRQGRYVDLVPEHGDFRRVPRPKQ